MGDTKTYNIGTIQNAQFVTQSPDYQELMQAVEKQRKRIKRLQGAGDTEGALEESAELESLEKKLDDFKENVFQLYETFSKIEINTERLAKAKAYFENGEFREADAILNAVNMAQDLNRLNEREQQIDHEKAEITKSKTQLSDEYLIKARLQIITYEQFDWFEKACEYFEQALRASRTPAAVYEYALFLQKHNCFRQATPLYQEILCINRALARETPCRYLPNLATTLNDLGILQQAQKDLTCACNSYKEALQIRRALAEENRNYLPDVAGTLNNLGLLQQAENDFLGAQHSHEEALQIYRTLAENAPDVYSSNIAITLNNLANSQLAANNLTHARTNYEEALQIRRDLAEKNRRTYLPDVAETLNNLAILQTAQNELIYAQENYVEALQIRRALAEKNPRIYLFQVATTMINLSIFYLQDKPNQEQSITLAIEALEILMDLQELPASRRHHITTAFQVLQANGVDLSEAEA